MSTWWKVRLGLGAVGLVIGLIRLAARSSSPDYSYDATPYDDGYGAEAVDQESIDRLLETIAAQQAAAGGQVELVAAHAGYRGYEGADLYEPLAEGSELVAVDVELTVPPESSFDFDDIDVVVNGENLGSNPYMQRLSPTGEARAWDDPMFLGSDHVRVLLAYSVPAGTTEVSLAYWGSNLTEVPIALDDTGAPSMLEETY